MRWPRFFCLHGLAKSVWAARFFGCIGLFGFLLFFVGCGNDSTEDQKAPQASLGLVSPRAPLGLSYAEQVTLTFRYSLSDKPQPGVALKVRIDAAAGGGTLSTPMAVTNDLGEASVRLTAGTSESAFHVNVSAPFATDLVVDVAVSRFAFGTLRAILDASEVSPDVSTVRAGLFPNASCSALPPTPTLVGALRNAKQPVSQKEFVFGTLLLSPYAVVGRGETANGRLLAYGCVEVPEMVLRSDLNIPVEVPLGVVTPSPAGSYLLETKLASKWPVEHVWKSLTCKNGLGQTFTEALIAALPVGDLPKRLFAARGTVDANGCRVETGKPDDPDEIVDRLLSATTVGPTLTFAAVEFWPALAKQTLLSRLVVRGSAQTGFVAEHELLKVELQTQTQAQTQTLLSAPKPVASEFAVKTQANTLHVPSHDFAIRFPSLWESALRDLVLVPKGVLKTPGELFADTILAARYGTENGCAAIEAAICDQHAAPCRGPVQTACAAATTGVSGQLQAVLTNPKPGFDFRLTVVFRLDDPDGTLEAQTLQDGLLSGEVTDAGGVTPVAGSATGVRERTP